MEHQLLLRGSSSPSKLPSWTLFLAVCAVGIGGTFQYGYNVSIINAPTQHIHKFLNETWTSRYHKELNPDLLTFLWSVIASIFSLGGLCGALMGGSMAIRLGRELLGEEKYWPLLLSSSCFPAFAQLLFLPWFPESPRYLLIDRGDELSCAKALKRFHGSSEYRREMEDIQRESSALDGEKPKKPWQLFTDRGVRWQLITVIVMTMGQQLSGINAIYFYATYIFEAAGISAEKIPYVTLGTGACECLTALSCGLLIDYVGRRYLIIGGYLLMTLWCTVLTLSLTYQDLYSWVPYVSMMCIFAFILSFGLGPGGITNTLIAELFVQSSRPAAYMIGGTLSWISFFTIGMLFPFIVNGLKQYCFLVFLLECSFVAAFIFLVIPETKNKSFLEIKKEFHKLNFGRNTRKKETELYERTQLQDEFLKSPS
ncbi:solute carrier family 2, facilitated glucose transporter member 11-like isoform X4 [Pipra filicauda]|uniref:Solute carrier family 2, facilitated glucose transporter member 5 n=1 Tax=Pipra filicauda TaxID=649802 RepID=A0A7R5KSQ7_9PASS|nr:solute carrier family 2, facilitated glucose transporter member 11-like isoform X4 [Pipra filicauda]